MTASNHRSRPTQPGAPALIEHESLKFLIVNNPAQATLPQFVKVCFVSVLCMLGLKYLVLLSVISGSVFVFPLLHLFIYLYKLVTVVYFIGIQMFLLLFEISNYSITFRISVMCLFYSL